MQDYPLFFGLMLPVRGSGFFAMIHIDGRLVAQKETEGWWLDGVEPATVAEGGSTLTEAFVGFKTRCQSVAFDLASQARDFVEFEQSAASFFGAVDADDERRWVDARAAIRSGAVAPPEELRLKGDSRQRQSQVRVERIDDASSGRFAPNENRLDAFEPAA